MLMSSGAKCALPPVWRLKQSAGMIDSILDKLQFMLRPRGVGLALRPDVLSRLAPYVDLVKGIMMMRLEGVGLASLPDELSRCETSC